MLFAAAMPAFGQPRGPQQTVETLQDTLRVVELRDGPNSADLIHPLTALGLVYQESGEPFLAAAALRQAVQVVRVNYGLHSLGQAPLIRRLITNAESIGDRAAAWDLEQDLLALAARYPDDIRTVEILRDTADRRMDVLARYNAGEFPPEVVLGCYYEGPHAVGSAADVMRGRNCASGSAHRVREGLVKEAQTYYSAAVRILLRNRRYSSDELPPLLMQLVDSSYRYGNAALGRRSLVNLVAYRAVNVETWLARAEALAQLADWDLMNAIGRDQQESALTGYLRAYRLLEEQGAAKESVEQLFSPEAPVFLPVFLPNPLVTDGARESTGHIEVAFDVDRYGRSRHVRILDTSDNATRLTESRLVQLIARARFRPRLADGEVVDATAFVVRYDFNALEDAESAWPLYWEPAEALRRGELIGWRAPND